MESERSICLNEEAWSFKCKECGSVELYVEYEYATTDAIVETLPCTCDQECEFAAQRTRYVTTTYLDKMPLDEDHRMGDVEESEEVEVVEEEGDYEVQCSECLENAEEEEWYTEVEPLGFDEDSAEFYVRCAGCDREIDFGWSHPERGGRIWPAECSDFNPWKSWPEPRYYEIWLKRGWIRPDFRR